MPHLQGLSNIPILNGIKYIIWNINIIYNDNFGRLNKENKGRNKKKNRTHKY